MISPVFINHFTAFSQGCYPIYNVINGNISSLFAGSGTVGGYYRVTSGLVIDKNFTFDGTEIRFLSGADVFVNKGVDLTLTNKAYFTACDGINMWDGIYVNGAINYPCNLKMDQSSVIEDAITGVYLSTGFSFCQFDDAIFNRNYVHLFYDVGNFFGASGLASSYIINSSFYCKDKANSTGTDGNYLLAPYGGQRTNIGLHLYRFNPSGCNSMTIGNVNQGNEFRNCKTAIYSYEFNTIISNNSFIKTNFGINQEHNGCAYISTNILTECQTGIRLNDIHTIEVLNNDLTIGVTGIRLLNTPADATVSENVITDYSTAIWSINTTPSSVTHYVNIKNNNISSINAPVVYGIRVQHNLNLLNNHEYEVSGNTLTLVQKGISLSNINTHSKISDNPSILVQTNPASGKTHYGIDVNGCSNVLIENNNVLSDDEDYCYNNLHGIRSNGSDLVTIKCNNVEFVGRACWFGGITPNNGFYLNSMGEARNQLYLNNNTGGLASQGTSRNTYLNSSLCSSFIGAYGQNSNIPSGYTTFLYNGGNQVPNISDMYNFGIPSDFQIGGLNNTLTCIGIGPPDYADDIDYKIALDTMTYYGDAINYTWWNRNYLNRRLQTDTALLNSDSIFYTFKNKYADSLITTLYVIEDSLAALAYDSSKHSSIAWIRDTLNNMSSTHRCEQNYINYFTILLNVITAGYNSIDSVNHADLLTIASQCPYTGGQSVFLARALLAEFDTINYDYDDCENLNFSPRLSDSKTFKEGDVIVYPNPANNEITFSINPQYKLVEIKLFNINGGQVISQIYDGSGKIKLNIEKITEGIYFYKVNASGAILKRGKVCIIH